MRLCHAWYLIRWRFRASICTTTIGSITCFFRVWDSVPVPHVLEHEPHDPNSSIHRQLKMIARMEQARKWGPSTACTVDVNQCLVNGNTYLNVVRWFFINTCEQVTILLHLSPRGPTVWGSPVWSIIFLQKDVRWWVYYHLAALATNAQASKSLISTIESFVQLLCLIQK